MAELLCKQCCMSSYAVTELCVFVLVEVHCLCRACSSVCWCFAWPPSHKASPDAERVLFAIVVVDDNLGGS